MATGAKLGENSCQTTNVGTGADNIRWLQISVDGITMYPLKYYYFSYCTLFLLFIFIVYFNYYYCLMEIRYGKFLNFVLLDSVKRMVKYTYTPDNIVSVTVPHFFEKVGTFKKTFFLFF